MDRIRPFLHETLIDNPTVGPVSERVVTGVDGRPWSPTEYAVHDWVTGLSKTVRLCGITHRALLYPGKTHSPVNRCRSLLCYPRHRRGQFVPGCGVPIASRLLAAAWEAFATLEHVYVAWWSPPQPDDPWGVDEGPDNFADGWGTGGTRLSRRTPPEVSAIRERLASRARGRQPPVNYVTYWTRRPSGPQLWVFSDQPLGERNPGGRGRPALDPRRFYVMPPEEAFEVLHRDVLIVGATESVTSSAGWAALSRISRPAREPETTVIQLARGERPEVLRRAYASVTQELRDKGYDVAVVRGELHCDGELPAGFDLVARLRSAIDEARSFSKIAP